MDRHEIAAGGLAAAVKAEGAELCSLRDAAGRELLWQAGSVWPRHAPVLFPIVGRLNNDQYRYDGKTYHLGQHGFARDRSFTWLERTPTSCRLVLIDDAATRALYPFAFRFEVAYSIAAGALAITFTATNPGETVLPASMGAHPAFAWPLLPDIPKTAHVLTFEAEETAPIRRAHDGLILPDPEPNPVAGKSLALHDDLFSASAIILDHPASRTVRYTAPGAPAIEVSWEGFPYLGLWSRADATLFCIEPWHGMSDPLGFNGDFAAKPGLMLIPPGGRQSATHRIRVS